ncbi:hypothetical protein ACJX0J_014826, partial [Zea mays]
MYCIDSITLLCYFPHTMYSFLNFTLVYPEYHLEPLGDLSKSKERKKNCMAKKIYMWSTHVLSKDKKDYNKITFHTLLGCIIFYYNIYITIIFLININFYKFAIERAELKLVIFTTIHTVVTTIFTDL